MKLIPLTRGKSAIVDDLDYEALSQHRWYFAKGYAVRNQQTPSGQRALYMHRVIAGTPAGMFTDHISGNKLDNRRENLRNCNKAENNRNASRRRDNKTGYKGVSVKRGRFLAQIQVGTGIPIHLGYFSTPEDAHNAYQSAALRLHGEFARTN